MIDVYYNVASDIGPGWVSGSTRMRRDELYAWMMVYLNAGKAVLITAIEEL